MPSPSFHRLILAGLAWPALLGFILGTAVQLQQPRLSSAWVYGGLCLLALVGWTLVATFSIVKMRRVATLLVVMAGLGFGVTGLRCVAFVQQALNPALEGQAKLDLKDTNGKFLIKELIAAA